MRATRLDWLCGQSVTKCLVREAECSARMVWSKLSVPPVMMNP